MKTKFNDTKVNGTSHKDVAKLCIKTLCSTDRQHQHLY